MAAACSKDVTGQSNVAELSRSSCDEAEHTNEGRRQVLDNDILFCNLEGQDVAARGRWLTVY